MREAYAALLGRLGTAIEAARGKRDQVRVRVLLAMARSLNRHGRALAAERKG